MEPGKTEEEIPAEIKPKISPELVKKYREIFDGFDKEQDGYVLAKDIPGVFKILGVSISEQ
jgi:Ca2+-binding EF-hand superfamily protein